MKRLAAGLAINFVLVHYQVSSSFLDIVGLQHLLTLELEKYPVKGFFLLHESLWWARIM